MKKMTKPIKKASESLFSQKRFQTSTILFLQNRNGSAKPYQINSTLLMEKSEKYQHPFVMHTSDFIDAYFGYKFSRFSTKFWDGLMNNDLIFRNMGQSLSQIVTNFTPSITLSLLFSSVVKLKNLFITIALQNSHTSKVGQLSTIHFSQIVLNFLKKLTGDRLYKTNFDEIKKRCFPAAHVHLCKEFLRLFVHHYPQEQRTEKFGSLPLERWRYFIDQSYNTKNSTLSDNSSYNESAKSIALKMIPSMLFKSYNRRKLSKKYGGEFPLQPHVVQYTALLFHALNTQQSIKNIISPSSRDRIHMEKAGVSFSFFHRQSHKLSFPATIYEFDRTHVVSKKSNPESCTGDRIHQWPSRQLAKLRHSFLIHDHMSRFLNRCIPSIKQLGGELYNRCSSKINYTRRMISHAFHIKQLNRILHQSQDAIRSENWQNHIFATFYRHGADHNSAVSTVPPASANAKIDDTWQRPSLEYTFTRPATLPKPILDSEMFTLATNQKINEIVTRQIDNIARQNMTRISKSINYQQLSEQVYSNMVRRLRVEKERLGSLH